MKVESEDIRRILEQLTQTPLHITKATHGIEATQLYLRTDTESWSIHDILAHLRACIESLLR